MVEVRRHNNVAIEYSLDTIVCGCHISTRHSLFYIFYYLVNFKMNLNISHFEFGSKLGTGAFSNLYFGRRKSKPDTNLGIKVINVAKVRRARRVREFNVKPNF